MTDAVNTRSTQVHAAAETIERVFGIPARTIRDWAQTGHISRHGRGSYDVREVLAERARRAAA